jgi:hypothetical protein
MAAGSCRLSGNVSPGRVQDDAVPPPVRKGLWITRRSGMDIVAPFHLDHRPWSKGKAGKQMIPNETGT